MPYDRQLYDKEGSAAVTAANTPSVCIIGAGSMGVVTGYHLGLAGADVTFLVRPHRVESLSNPQLLYCFDDNTLKSYSGYDIISDPSQLSEKLFDFAVITLDGPALCAEAGQKLVDEIGRAFRGTSTGVILGSMGFDLRGQLLERSGLAGSQVTNSVLNIYAYEAQAMTMPVRPGMKPELLEQADYGYTHPSPYGFTVDLSAPEVGQAFASLYSRSGVSQCGVISADEYKAQVGWFAVLMAMDAMGWPKLAESDPKDETWQLGVDAMHEIQGLSIFRSDSQTASERSSAEGIFDFFRQMEEQCLPFDMSAFNRYHHGGKVNGQDLQILVATLKEGEAEGAEMPSLRKLIALFPNN